MSGHIALERTGARATITIANPEKRNAMSLAMWQDLTAKMHECGQADDLRVVVLRGEGGKAFVSGADIGGADVGAGAHGLQAYDAATSDAYHAVAQCPHPVLVQIDGYCIGGGLGLAVAADIRICDETSQFAIPAAKLGVGYSVDGVAMLMQLVGPSMTKDILFTARRLGAEEALRVGLVSQIVGKGQVADRIDQMASAVIDNAPLTLRTVKQTVAALARRPDDAALGHIQELVDGCFASADHREGLAAFFAKRPAVFKGR